MIRRILVAVDDSPRAAAVFESAVALARLSGARMIVFRALAIPPEFPTAAATTGGDPLFPYLHEQALEALQGLVRGAPDVQCDVVVGESRRIARAILAAADEHDVDLVVIGSHGYDPIDRLLGTTAAKVVNLATRNVLVVHRAPPASTP